MEKTIIKCTECSFKYYEGDVHVCGGKSVEEKPLEEEAVSVEEKPKEKKIVIKTRKESFKIWKDS